MATAQQRPVLLIIAAASLIGLLSMGLRSTVPIFQVPMLTELEWEGRTGFAIALALQNLMWGALAPVFGGMADKLGSGRVLALGGIATALGFVLMAQSTDPLSFAINGGLILGSAQAAAGMAIALGAVGRMVPEKRRSWAFGIVTMGTSAGMIVVVPIGQVFLDAFGWSMGFMALGSFGVLLALLAYPLRGKPTPQTTTAAVANLTVGQALSEAFQHRSYVLLVAGFFVCGFHVAFIGTHLPAYVNDLSLPPETGATALVLVGFVNIMGAYMAGVLGGKREKRTLLSYIYFGRAIAIAAMLLAPKTELTIYVFAAAMGLFWLSTVPLTSGLVAVMFGTQYMSMLFGFVFFSHQVGSFLGVYLGGALFDATGSYEVVWWMSVALGIFAAIIHLPIVEKPVERPALAAG